MWYFYLLSWLAFLVQLIGIVFSIGKNLMWFYFKMNSLNYSITKKTGAGLFYLAELIEEYASVAKKLLNYLIFVSAYKSLSCNFLVLLHNICLFNKKMVTVLAFGLLLFEDLPSKIVLLCIVNNVLYYVSILSFPIINVYSPVFISSIVCFVLHNYLAFSHFSTNFVEFSQVLSYMTIFCCKHIIYIFY